jgi:hypothetical protein
MQQSIALASTAPAVNQGLLPLSLVSRRPQGDGQDTTGREERKGTIPVYPCRVLAPATPRFGSHDVLAIAHLLPQDDDPIHAVFT